MENYSFSEFLSANTSLSEHNCSTANVTMLCEMNKENVDIIDVPKQHKSSRMSLLISLDPLNPYSPSQCNIKEGSLASPKPPVSALDQSWNFMNLDNASGNDDANECQRADDNGVDPFQSNNSGDFLCDSITDDCGLLEQMPGDNRSPLTDVSSSLDESGVAVDSLLPISPIKHYVDKSEHDKLRKYLRAKQLEWDNAEKAYREEIDNLRKKNESELRLATEEKEAVINELVRENEENLEMLRTSNCRLMRDKQAEIDQCASEMSQLRAEITYLNCAQLASAFLVEQYSDSLETAVHQHGLDMAAIADDHRDMEAVLNKYLHKIGSSQTVIANQKQNELVLREQLAKCEQRIEQLQSELAGKVAELEATVGSGDRDIANLRADSERKLKRKEIRIAILENAENNLKAELELRIRERDQFKKSLVDVLEQS